MYYITRKVDLEEVHPLPKTVQLVYPVSNEDPYLVELHLTPDEGNIPSNMQVE